MASPKKLGAQTRGRIRVCQIKIFSYLPSLKPVYISVYISRVKIQARMEGTQMYRQCSLFEDIQLTEQWLEDTCSPLYSPLWRMIREPFNDLLDSRGRDKRFRILTEGECAQFLRPQIVERARELFDEHPDIKIEKCKHQLLIRVRDELAIIPKKLRPRWRDTGLTFSSYNTHQNTRIWRQQDIDGFPRLPRVIVGYQFVAEMTDIKIWLAYPHGKWIRHCYLLPDQSGVVLGQVVLPPHAEEQDDDFRVKPKKSRRELR